MKTPYRIGTRSSRLARTQTENAVARLRRLVPGLSLEIVPLSSPGDRDRQTDLRDTAPDFFTRDLDEALRDGAVDAAMHSAKDVPPEIAVGLDWVWLPWGEDARDAWVLPPGSALTNLPDAPRIGVSSERRDTYAHASFPHARLLPIRGNIEDRLAQLDAGSYDALLMAGAALLRLDLAERITQWIPLDRLPTPEGQGRLCMTFRADDPRSLRLRSLCVASATFVGAGAGSAETCTVAGVHALARCECCLHDALIDPALLNHLPPGARRIPVGKRAGSHSVPQEQTTHRIVDEVRKGRRVVRLKGGDPGLFGRLAEETEALDARALPYRVLPGISSLNAATTATGMLLTRRGVSRGFCVLSARGKGGSISDVSAAARAKLPCVFFMGTHVMETLVAQLRRDGMAPDTPAAVVFHAGADLETIVRAPLDRIAAQAAAHAAAAGATAPPPGLFLVGDVTRYGFARDHGALRNQRILLTCSDALLDRAADTVRDLGGRPVALPLIGLTPDDAATSIPARLRDADWLVLTSPSAVRVLLQIMRDAGQDLRTLPCLAVSGPATAGELRAAGLGADLCPDRDFGAKGLLAAAPPRIGHGARVLRLRSDRAGPGLADALRRLGADVADIVLYRNQPLHHDRLPEFDAAFFASGSAVQAFVHAWGVAALHGKTLVAIGPPTARALEHIGRTDRVVPDAATVEDALRTLAGKGI